MNWLSLIQYLNPMKWLGAIWSFISRPKLRIYYDPNQTYHTTPMIEYNGIPGFFCHVMVSNDGKRIAKNCRGRLIEVKVQDSNGIFNHHPAFRTPVVLKWAHEMDYGPRDIEHDLPRRLDLCFSAQVVPNVLFFFTEILPNGNRTTYPPGNYLVTVRVDGENVSPVDSIISINYSGVWNQITINTVV